MLFEFVLLYKDFLMVDVVYHLVTCYTSRNEVRGGILESPRPSVCPSVRLSVDARLGKMVSSA